MSVTGGDRPRSASEIVDGAIQLLRHNYQRLVTISAISYLPFVLIQLTVFRGVLAAANGGSVLSVSSPLLGAYYAFWFLSSALIDLALTIAAADAYGGRLIDVGAVFRRTLPGAGPTLIAVTIKYSLIVVCAALFFLPVFALTSLGSGQLATRERLVLIGSLAILAAGGVIAGALYVLASFFAATPAIALEGTGPLAALQRSIHLSRHNVRHVLAGLALAYVIYLVGQSPAFLLAAGGFRTVVQFVSVGTTILLFPILSVTRVLLYYDARIRQEGYDIEQMAQGLAAVGGAPPN